MIDRPIEEVFRFVHDPRNDAFWQTTLIESKQVDEGPLRVGVDTDPFDHEGEDVLGGPAALELQPERPARVPLAEQVEVAQVVLRYSMETIVYNKLVTII